MGILDRLRKTPSPSQGSLPPPDPVTTGGIGLPPPTPESAARAVVILPEGGWLDAVGESFYRDAYLALFGRPPAVGFVFPVIAELVPEPDNVHDPAAVAIRIAG